MIKNAELANENSCFNRAEPDEPIFVLRSSDELAPSMVRTWAIMYFKMKSAQPMGMTPKQRAKEEEAMALAAEMDRWHEAYRRRSGQPIKSPHVQMTYNHAKSLPEQGDEPLTAKRVIERLCRLQANLFEELSEVSAADCICGEGGFWRVDGYDGTWENGYRNDGVALRFIEQAVREKLQRMRLSVTHDVESIESISVNGIKQE